MIPPAEESEMSEAEEEGEEESDAWGYSYGTFQPKNIHKLRILKPKLFFFPMIQTKGFGNGNSRDTLENESIEVCR